MNGVQDLNIQQLIQNRRENVRNVRLFNTPRVDFLTNSQISRHYNRDVTLLRTGEGVDTSTQWITSNPFFAGASHLGRQIGDQLGANLIENYESLQANGIFSSGCAEFLQFLENEIQRWLVETSTDLLNNDQIDIDSFNYCQQLVSQNGDDFNQTMRQLFYYYYNGTNTQRRLNRARWDGDIQTIIDTVVTKLKESFYGSEENSRFIQLIPRLQLMAPARGRNRWTWELNSHPQSMLILFSLIMIRLPSVNLSRPNMMRELAYVFPILYEDSLQNENLPVEVNDANLQSMLYFIPEYNRVFGIWPKTVQVKTTSAGNAQPFAINHKMNLLRTMIVKVQIPYEIYNNNGYIAFEYLFYNRNQNLLRFVRDRNPFQLNDRTDRRTRLYVSLTIYADKNEVVLFIPWVLEGRLDNNIDYDVSEFCEEWERVLALTGSGQSLVARTNDINEFYFVFTFIRDPSLPLSAAVVAALQDVPVVQQERQRRRRQRGAPPTRRSERVRQRNAMNHMLVGAPYAGTPKEKHFLLGSMVNRFTKSPALFKTPERRMNSCLMMSLIKAQMYCYQFENHKCVELSITGTTNARLESQNMYVECVTNFDDYQEYIHQCPFLVKKGSRWYVKLFHSEKWKKTENGEQSYYEGARNEIEEELWEMAAEEIWYQLQVANECNIEYTDFSSYCQYFSNFFNVAICIYDVEMRGHRVHIFTPYHKTPAQMSVAPYFCMINIVYDQGHIHAITNLAAFMKNKARKDELRLHNYCPVCDQKQCVDLRGTKQQALNHITKCFQKTIWEIDYIKENEKQSETQNKKVQLQFRKNPRTQKKEPYYQCLQCYQPVNQHDYHQHVCYIQKKKNTPLNENKIFVFDVECAQLVTEEGIYRHEVNCVYLCNVYRQPNDEGVYFANEVDFLNAILEDDKYKDSVIFAHNGGSYDVHFILRILERLEIQHTFIPSPTSKHKFLQIHIIEKNITFKDFMRFMPGSLKNIAISFEIPVGKGEFPHRFNNGSHDDYIGCLPPIDTEEDWWSLKFMKSEKDLVHFRKWYEEQTLKYCTCLGECQCELQKWDFQFEIRKYCLQDVIVLAEIIKRFREQCMHFEPSPVEDQFLKWQVPLLDPLTFMTLPQITMQTLIHGYQETSYDGYNFHGITSYPDNNRGGLHPMGALWVHLSILKKGWDLSKCIYLGNSIREYYDFHGHINVDGYYPEEQTIFLYLKCDYFGCPNCCMEYHEFNLILPQRGIYTSEVKKHLDDILKHLNQVYKHVETIWECQFHPEHDPHFSPYLLKCYETPLKPEQCFKGGRTEVFKPYANAENKNMAIKYYDVTSLYPSVYAYHRLPMGTPIHLLGEDINPERFHPTSSNRYFGYARVKITPDKKDVLGLLPVRDEETGRLYFPVHPLEGCWGTEEIYLAMQNGYKLDEVYEIYHWEKEQSSTEHLKDYVAFFFRMKMEAEGWKKMGCLTEEPSEQEQQETVEKVYHDSQQLCRIRPHCVRKDPVKRALAKLYLNSLWGKWAQKPAKSCHTTIYGVQQFLELWHNSHIDQQTCHFREISPMVFKVNYNMKSEYIPSVRHGNLFIAGYVTIHARCVLHKQMLVIGPENVIYCDTDSIIAFIKAELLPVLTGTGLGKWADEYPNETIKAVFALAPKLYSIMLEKNNEISEKLKAKGVMFSLNNQKLLQFDNVKGLIEDLIHHNAQQRTIKVDNFTIYSNSTNSNLPYGKVYSRENIKEVRGVITKRKIADIPHIEWNSISEIETSPFGFDSSST